MTRVRELVVCVGLLALAGCISDGSYGNRQLAGGVGSDTAGVAVSPGSNRITAAASGPVISALVGPDIGQSLNDQDRQNAFVAAQDSFASGRTTRWSNTNTGRYDTVDPTPTYTGPTGQTCRNFSHTMWADGRNGTVEGKACRQTDGSWQITS